MKRLFLASFTSDTAIAAMNSKWCKRRNCAVEIEMSAEVASMLNFGNSPYILKDGEDKETRQRKSKGVISRGNLKPTDIGGMDADDLDSLGDESHARTVFQDGGSDSESDDYEEDDVSHMSEEEFVGTDDEEENTVGQEGDESSDDEEMDVDDDADDNSAFSTKASRKDLDGLAKGGRKVRGESNEDYKQRIDSLEKEKAELRDEMEKKMAHMEDMFTKKMAGLLKQMNQDRTGADGRQLPRPGAVSAEPKGDSISPEAGSGSASADPT